MATVSGRLPQRPHLDAPKREARELLNRWRNAEPEAFDRIRLHRRYDPKAMGRGNTGFHGPR